MDSADASMLLIFLFGTAAGVLVALLLGGLGESLVDLLAPLRARRALSALSEAAEALAAGRRRARFGDERVIFDVVGAGWLDPALRAVPRGSRDGLDLRPLEFQPGTGDLAGGYRVLDLEPARRGLAATLAAMAGWETGVRATLHVDGTGVVVSVPGRGALAHRVVLSFDDPSREGGDRSPGPCAARHLRARAAARRAPENAAYTLDAGA